MATFATLGDPREDFFEFSDALERTLAQVNAGRRFYTILVPQDPKVEVGGMGAATSGAMVKLHLAPLGGDIVRVSFTFALSQGM